MEAKLLLDRFDVTYTLSGEDLAKVLCPFHTDVNNPNGNINLSNGGYSCFACGKRGDIYDYLAAILKSSRQAVMELVKVTSDTDIDDDRLIDMDLIERWHQVLLKMPAKQKALADRKGLDLVTIRRHRLGMAGDRFTIPIRRSDGAILNVRQVSLTDREKKVINMPGHGKPRLFPQSALDAETIYITEGECKCLLLEQLGYSAMTSTGGAKNWNKAWGSLFAGKNVIVVYDIDESGRHGSIIVCKSVMASAKTVKNVILPLDIETYKHGDVTDFFLKAQRTKEEFDQCVEATPLWKPGPLMTRLQDDEEVYKATLGESSHAKFYNKFVSVECVISAKDTHPYVVPKKFKVTCTRDQEYCAFCPIFRSGEETPSVEISEKDPVLLELVNIKLYQQDDGLRKAACIPSRCRSCHFVPEESFNIEELRLIPQLAVSTHESEHVVRRAFLVGHGIETNTPYTITARSVPEPSTQYATLLAFKAERAVDSLSLFQVTPETKEELKIFQSGPSVAEIEAKLEGIYADLSANVTRIFQRNDVHLLYDLVYHSVLYVPLQGRQHKGWVEGLVVGDSGQGKSETIQLLLKHYKLGERVDCKGASAAGLLGGVQETAKRWFISWGIIPLNDRRMVVLEEAKGLSVENIAKMTDARSSGVVDISKIEKAKTHCRCRLIWISNPRSERKIQTYNYGVEAIKELVGSLEDIRRFDLACVVSSNDVPVEVVNSRESTWTKVEHTYTSSACRSLIMWAWSRKPDQVYVEPEAVDAVLDAANAMGLEYSSGIPLVEGADQRLKLLRLAAALAARLFSCSEDGETLIVRKGHVEAVKRYLDRMYSMPSFGYKDYSTLIKGEATLDNQATVVRAISELNHAADTVGAMLDANMITVTDLMDWSAVSYEEAKELIGMLVRKRALKRYRSAYVKTPAFLTLLKRLREGGELKGPPPPDHVRKEKGDF